MGSTTSVSVLTADATGGVDEQKICVPLRRHSKPLCKYEMAFKIGDGAYSDVRFAYRKDNKEKVCIKEINMTFYTAEYSKQLSYEFNILSQLNHPDIVKLHEVFHYKSMYYMVTEPLSGGDLFDSICDRDSYTEEDARRVMKSTTEALQYCHSHNVMHRDIKLENIILVDSSPNSKIKLIDFGFARVVHGDDKLTDIRGELVYMCVSLCVTDWLCSCPCVARMMYC
jgi:calcium-dependent protein kinase